MPALQPRRSRTEQAYRYLLEDMLKGRWHADDVLSAYALAKELEVSRTPVIEALKRLESQGLVEIIPQVGWRIVRPTADALLELFATRAALEATAAAAAARRLDSAGLADLERTLELLEQAGTRGDRVTYAALNERFHLQVVTASGMRQLAEMARTVWASLRYQIARVTVSDAQLRESATEHRELYEALRRGTHRRARAAAERHARLAGRRFLDELGQRPPEELVHEALIYGSDAEFLAATVPFVIDGLGAGERVLAVTTRHNAEILGKALGGPSDEVEFRDANEWYALPSHTLLSYQRYVEDSDRSRVRIVGEVAWDGAAAPAGEWMRYESLLNVAFAREPVTLMCPYDVRDLPDHIIGQARRTHPVLCTGAATAPSSDYIATAALLRDMDREAFSEPKAPAAETVITSDLRSVRTFILDQAKAAGLRGKSLQDTFLAVQEVAANVVARGAGDGLIRAWVEDGSLVYEVREEPLAVGDPLIAEPNADPAFTFEPRGLWMSRLLSDLVEVRSHADGLLVRLHVVLP